MPVPVITEITIPNRNEATDTQIRAAIRNAFASLNFGNLVNEWSDSGQNHYFVFEHIWDAEKPKGKVFIQLWIYQETNWSINVRTFDTWNRATRSGTGGSTNINILGIGIRGHNGHNLLYNPGSYQKLQLSAISHPEIKGFMTYQAEHLIGCWFFLRPAIKEEVFGYDDINYPWYFTTNDFATVHQCAGNGINPFNDAGNYSMESWSILKNRFEDLDNNEVFQIAPSPRIISPTNQGFIGRFSNDICLLSSNLLPMQSRLNVGLTEYLILCPKLASAVAIALN